MTQILKPFGKSKVKPLDEAIREVEAYNSGEPSGGAGEPKENPPDLDEKVKQGIMDYVQMAIGVWIVGEGKEWAYKDPITGKLWTIVIDESYMQAIENNLGLKGLEEVAGYRSNMMSYYSVQYKDNNSRFDIFRLKRLVAAVEKALEQRQIW